MIPGMDRRYAHGSSRASRLAFALFLAIAAIASYLSSSSTNVITGESQFVGMSVDQEIALGLQTTPQLASQYGGLLPDRAAQERVDRIGQGLLQSSYLRKSPYKMEFHLLADSKTVNAFALPGGQIFITNALYSQLEDDAQLAGVLAHEIGHVLERHSAQQLAKSQLTEGLTGAAVMASYDPQNPSSQNTALIAMMAGKLINMRFGRADEIESDRWGVRLLAERGYDPHTLIEVMKVLARASGGRSMPEFFSTHPNPENRIERIKAAIAGEFPESPARP